MTSEREKIPPAPTIIAGACLVIVLVLLAILIACGGAGRIPGMPATTNDFPTITPAATKIPTSFSGTCPAAIPTPGTRQVVTESLATMELNLTRPAARDLIPYTERGFSRELEAAVAWWMFPGFDEQNRQFRSYHRSTAEQKTGFPPDERIFFDEITTNLDTAESLSTISADMTLFRGITPGVAGIVLNSSAWNEAPFAGTSYDITVSLGQYADRDASGYVTVLVIPGRTGENALYINEDQREFLLPRGTSWDVVSIKTVKDLSVHADFILHNQTGHTARFSDVRLIYLGERKCV